MEGATGTGVAEEPIKPKPDPPPIQQEPENKPPPTGEEENQNHPKPEIKEEPKPSSSPSQTQGTKRKLASHGDFRNTNYFKIRAIIADLRPLFLQVIHAPDFRENKAVSEIRKQMKTMIELSRQLRTEEYCSKPMKLPKEQPSHGASKLEKHQEVEHQLHVAQPQNGNVPILLDDMKENITQRMADKTPGLVVEEKIPVKEIAEQSEERPQGTYVIGGSPVGWNFLVYPGRDPVYYGETKSSFRSRQAANIVLP